MSAPPVPRLHGVDVARGLAIVGMLLVDNRGGNAIGRQLVHAPWHGLRVADVVFPVFLLLVGVSMPFSRRAQRPRAALLRVVRLTVLGWLVVTAKYGFGGVATGVLGHIAGAYLLCWLLLRLPRRAQVPVAAGVLLTIGLVSVLLPPPGAGHPSLTPELSWAAWSDRTVGVSFSAEAPHSYLPSAATVFTGVLAGRALQRHGAAAVRRLAAGALAPLAVGLLLAPVLPVNKRLWTPSYVLVTGGIGLLVLAAALWLVDTRGWRRPFPQLEVLGRNAIVAFVVSELLFGAVLDDVLRPVLVRELTRWAGAPVAAWVWALASVAVVWSVCAALAHRGVVVRV
ncbi:heparan-alpha-glucosaminide N-acetyltransferase domain-containing protein [Geodermatophilus sp. TF02-6]|uniref:heparan-alpha-glucosaminide N-acetyltransferase domain-containing protein n=1 Tax=Geodermatophilus sp. TF02-6 TaxID=2250575 RepID=UPI00131430B5|nr:heparan-alpha-glucosaminide N-acetyltransferase domain-containing protein [Geodermatophilus sp. TF02-6]